MKKVLGLAILCVVVGLVVAVVCCHGSGRSVPHGSMLARLRACPLDASGVGRVLAEPLQGDCRPTDCGTNGPWAGQGNKYRSLHLPGPKGTGASNDHQLHIVSFRTAGPDRRDLAMDIVDGDHLVGVASNPAAVLTGPDLVDAEIVLSGPKPGCEHSADPVCQTPQSYYLVIKGYAEKPFWTSCAPGDIDPACAKLPTMTPVYAFQVTTGDGGCAVLCEPGITDRDDDLAGTAVVFRGDVYDDAGKGVKIRSIDGMAPAEKLNSSESDIFNIACYGTAISKLHFLHHTSAAMTTVSSKPNVAERQAILQLLTGDYCGNGDLHTVNGLPLRLDYNHPPHQPAFANVGLNGAQSIDALWSADGTGAVCIGTPRLTDVEAARLPGGDRKAIEQSLVDKITAGCDRAIPRCTAAQRADALNRVFAGYAISANSFAAP